MPPDNQASHGSWWRRSGWFVLLWSLGVLTTLLVATVFKFLILGAVKNL